MTVSVTACLPVSWWVFLYGILCFSFQRILSLETLRERNNQQLLVKEQEVETLRQQLAAKGGEVCMQGIFLQNMWITTFMYIHTVHMSTPCKHIHTKKYRFGHLEAAVFCPGYGDEATAVSFYVHSSI